MRVRYTVYAPERGIRILGMALTPPLHRQAVGWQCKGAVYGQPGTQAVPMSGPQLPQSIVNRAAGGISTSHDAPNVIYPRLYYDADTVKEHAPVSRCSDNQMPMPADTTPAVILSRRAYMARIGGLRQVYQPQVIQRWLPRKPGG